MFLSAFLKTHLFNAGEQSLNLWVHIFTYTFCFYTCTIVIAFYMSEKNACLTIIKR